MDSKKVFEYNRVREYLMMMRPVLDKAALFSDESEDYLIPPEPDCFDNVKIRFRTFKNNVDAVLIVYDDKEEVMEKVESVGVFDYYETSVQLSDVDFKYYFEIISGRITCIYDKVGVGNKGQLRDPFCIRPGFHVPSWAKGAVMYQIFTDRFYNGDYDNDVIDGEYSYLGRHSHKAITWDKIPDAHNTAEFYGGDLEGIRKKLDYLQDLGVEVIYLNPIFVSPSNHKYDTQDYDYVDPHFGRIVKDGGRVLSPGEKDNTNAEKYMIRTTDMANLEASNEVFANLTKEIHQRGMKIILDGVFNHCGSFNKWMDREKIYKNKSGYMTGAYIEKESPYREFFGFSDDSKWPDNGCYDGWWDHETLPKLQYEQSPKLEEYILGVAKKWLKAPYNIDGWRLDVAADLGKSEEFNHKFWKKFRKEVKSVNPDALILAEHYGDVTAWLDGDEWDTVMNYDAFMDPVTWFMTGVNKHSEIYQPESQGNITQFLETMNTYMNKFPTQSLYCAMNELSNHDHSRFLTRTNHMTGRVTNLGAKAASQGVNKAILRAAVILQMTWPGAPTIYYGDEAGVCGFTDPDNRRTYPWGREDKELISFFKEVIKIHKSSKVFRTGSIKMVKGETDILGYGRFSRQEQFITIINISSQPGTISIPAWELGIPRKGVLEQLIFSNETGYSIAPIKYELDNGCFDIQMQKYSAVILKKVGEV